MTVDLLDIIGYILICSIWISMYIKNKKEKNNEITPEIAEKWGAAEYSGLIGQVKSNNEDNLVYKDRTEKMFITNDMEKK